MAAEVKPKSNRMLLIFGIFVAALAFALNLLLSRTPGGPGGLGEAKNTPVVVALTAIPKSTQITSSMVTVQMFSVDQAPPFAFSDKNKVLGNFAAIDIHQGQAISDNLVVSNQGVVPANIQPFLDIPTGYVAMQIPTGELIGAGGYIQPDDRIDIIATLGPVTKVAFTNLHILRVGPAGAPNVRGISSSLTVVVTLTQAEELKFLLDNTNYRYVLESWHDYNQPPTLDGGVDLNYFKNAFHFH
jgi:Flp pilus assembly protein CpaB